MSLSPSVLLVTSNFPPEIGGPAKFTADFADWLTKRDINCHVLATAPKSKRKRELGIYVDLVGRNTTILYRFFQTILRMKKTQTDKTALVCGLFYEALLAKILFNFSYVAKVPSDIVWDRARNNKATDLDVDSFQGSERGFYKLQRILFTKALNSAKSVIVPSEHLRNLVERWGVPQKSISVIRNSGTISQIVHDEEKDYDVVSVGRLIPLKGNDELIRTVAELHLSLLILGDGEEMAALGNLARELKAQVTFLGNVSRAQVVEKVRRSKVYVLNSKHEGSPNSLIEAMALGVPVVARDNPGTRELISDLENGLLVNNAQPLKTALTSISRDPELRKRLGLAGYEFARTHLNREVNFQKIYELMD